MKYDTTVKTGYKATDKNMKCRGFQFELGKWYEQEGELVLCENGFHFCEQPSGVWDYYSEKGTRCFKVEVEKVLAQDWEPGADRKRVCGRIRLVEEIVVTGDKNTGDRNTGDRNTGDWNTGYSNTGNRNTGDWNTGNGNCTNRAAGFFCSKEPCIVVFDKQTKFTYDQFVSKFPEYLKLCNLLHSPLDIPFEPYKNIPGITKAKLKALHKKHLEAK